ncbi:hypothetical protein BC835DRAFT_1307710 [Cytidiella melzeri]|nr:hypothetical protein BC835DRAFT_1307710 [Cytidiella melzeri]
MAPSRNFAHKPRQAHSTQYQQLELVSRSATPKKASSVSKAVWATQIDIDSSLSFSSALAKFDKLEMQTQHLLGDFFFNSWISRRHKHSGTLITLCWARLQVPSLFRVRNLASLLRKPLWTVSLDGMECVAQLYVDGEGP